MVIAFLRLRSNNLMLCASHVNDLFRQKGELLLHHIIRSYTLYDTQNYSLSLATKSKKSNHFIRYSIQSNSKFREILFYRIYYIDRIFRDSKLSIQTNSIQSNIFCDGNISSKPFLPIFSVVKETLMFEESVRMQTGCCTKLRFLMRPPNKHNILSVLLLLHLYYEYGHKRRREYM